MVKRFEGKVVIVTGSSNGFGREIAKMFGSEGAKLTICGRNSKALEETQSILLSAGVRKDHVVQVLGDLTDEAVQKQVIEATIEKFGKIDILINNAGGVAPDGSLTTGFEQPIENFDYVMQLNTKAVLVLTKLALPHLIKTKGEIIMISSIAGLNAACPNYPYYAMSKAALDQMMRSLAAKYITEGVRVNGINPGLCSTDIWSKTGTSPELVKKMETAVASRPDCLPAGFVGEPCDVAEAVAFLADRKSSRFIVGHTLVIDGGSSIITPIHSTNFLDLIK